MDVINYAFDTEGVGDFKYNFDVDFAKVLAVNITSKENQIIVNLEVEQVFDGDDLTIFNEFFVSMAVAIGFECGVQVKNIRNCGHSLPKRDGSRNYQINTGPICFSIPKKPKIPNEEQLFNALQFATGDNAEIEIYLRQYVFANSESNEIVRFSFLYNLLLQIVGDKQSKVDESILDVDPHCEQTISPLNGKPETVYTRLRNELAHKRENSKYSETKMTIEKIVNDFSKVVKKIILKQKK